MDPLKRIQDAKNDSILPPNIIDLIEKRFPLVISGIKRIEVASQINYPISPNPWEVIFPAPVHHRSSAVGGVL